MIKPVTFILDVDGVMTTGHFLYTPEGKSLKIFGPDDNDGLSLINSYVSIHFVTGDRKSHPPYKSLRLDHGALESNQYAVSC